MANAALPKSREVKIRVHDGVEIAVAFYMPEGERAVSGAAGAVALPLRQQSLPASPQFLWRETGPIELYVEHGYVYANMDVRGCGKSGGEFRLLDRNEQHDLYDVDRMARPPALVERQGRRHRPILFLHVAMVDGDRRSRRRSPASPPSTGSTIPIAPRSIRAASSGDFFGSYWWNQNRIINRHPANGELRASSPATSIC